MSPAAGFQTAAWLPKAEPGAVLQIRHDIEIPEPKDGEVLVKLECTGICHSDVHSIFNETPMETDIAGHEGVGYVVKLGANVAQEMMNARVGIKWQYSTCGTCEICPINETACPNQNNSGRNVRGTFAQYIAAPAKDVTHLPKELKSEILAPLLCAGLSMYSSISKAKLQTGDWLVLPGAGGGLGHLGVQIASRKGFKVIAVDSGDAKRKMCMELGATVFIDFKVDDVEKEVMRLTNGYGAHAVVVGAGSTAAYTQGFKLLRRLGTLVCVGLPRTDFDLPISPFWMVVRCLKVVGSSCGTRQEMEELLQMAVKSEVMPQVQVFDLQDINEIVNKLANFAIGGRVVLRIPQ
jgi:alcohol dehydrogenase, propanol-preferring